MNHSHHHVGILDIPKLAEQAAADIEQARSWKPSRIRNAPSRKSSDSKFGQ